MRIGVNTRFLLKGQLEGIGWFTFEVMKRWVQNHPEHDFVFFFDRPFDASFIFGDNVKGVVVPPPARHPILWKIWFDYTLPYFAKREQLDVLVSTDGFACRNLKSIPQLTVIHDLAYEYEGFGIPEKPKRFLQKYVPQYAKVSKRLATVSEFSKQDMVTKYGVDADKIDVVYNGIGEGFAKAADQELIDLRTQFSEGKKFFMFLGALHPRKNVLRIIQAFDQFKKQSVSDYKLIMVGRDAWGNDDFYRTFEKLEFKKDIIFESNLETQKLRRLLSASEALVYPSLFEGFGIPIVEAMASYVPVITSNVSSTKEIGGKAAILVDPYQVDEISKAMMDIFESPELREELAQKGFEHQKKYSWDQTASRMWDALEKTVK